MKNDMGVPASPSGHSEQAPEPASGLGHSASVPNAICAYPIAGWRLDEVKWDQRDGQPDGWIVSLHRDEFDWRTHRRSVCVMARSDIGPLEAWDEALRIALREDDRDAARRAELNAAGER